MRRAVVGAALGIGLGIGLLSVLIVLTTAWWIAILNIWIIVPLFILGLIGFAIGRRYDRGRPPLRRFWLPIGTIILSWPLWALAPLWARELQIRWLIAKHIPTPPGCTLVQREIATYAFDNEPGFRLVFHCRDKPATAIAFCRRELPKLGWKRTGSTHSSGYIWHGFRRWGCDLTMVGMTTIRGFTPVNELQMWGVMPNLTYTRGEGQADRAAETLPEDDLVDPEHGSKFRPIAPPPKVVPGPAPPPPAPALPPGAD